MVRARGLVLLLTLAALTTALYPIAPLLSRSENQVSRVESQLTARTCHTGNPARRIISDCGFDYRIIPSQTSLSLLQGTSLSLGVSIVLTHGVPESVALSMFGNPPGANITIDPASGVPSYSSTLTVSTSLSTPTVDSNILILAVSLSGLVRKSVIALTVAPAVHDVAVVAVGSPTLAIVGDVLRFNATISNYGSLAETVDVQLLVNRTIAASGNVRVRAQSWETVGLEWNTSGYSLGTYNITVSIPAVEGERNLENNIFKTDNLILMSRTNPTPTHTGQLITILPRDLVIIAAVGEAAVASFLLIRRRNRS